MFPDLLGARTLSDTYQMSNTGNGSGSSFGSTRAQLNQAPLNAMHAPPSSQFGNLQLNHQLNAPLPHALNHQFNNQLNHPLNSGSAWPLTAASMGVPNKSATQHNSNQSHNVNSISGAVPGHNHLTDSTSKLTAGSSISGLSAPISNHSTNSLLSWYHNPRIDTIPSAVDYIG
jgi:hypothetical protein